MKRPLDSLEARWRMLAPHVEAVGPDDDRPRPAVLLFHGCGGVQSHLRDYAHAASSVGVRAFIVDSYAARGWSRAYGLLFVCTGARFWGSERAGDVLAAVQGVSQRPDVDGSKIALAGWSHGAWAIMDLMTMKLRRKGEAGLSDASPKALEGLKSLFLAYPYVGYGTRSRHRDWVRGAPTLGIVAPRDHLGPAAWHEAAYLRARAGGCEVEVWAPEGATHAFDQPDLVLPLISPMRRDLALGEEARRRFAGHLRKTLL